MSNCQSTVLSGQTLLHIKCSRVLFYEHYRKLPLPSNSIFVFMKSHSFSHYQGQRQTTEGACHQSIPRAMCLSGYFTSSQTANSIWWRKDKALILMVSVIRNKRDEVWNKQQFSLILTFCHMAPPCTNVIHVMPSLLEKVEYVLSIPTVVALH